MNLTRHAHFWLPLLLATAACTGAPLDDDAPNSSQEAVTTDGTAVSQAAVTDCRAFDGDVKKCDAAGCGYYFCSEQCHPKNTSLCNAGCTAECNAACRAHDGDLNGCNAAGCAYYTCSNRCQAKGTSLCDAGCSTECQAACRVHDGDLNGCNAAGCAYYTCSNRCYTKGTVTPCEAGCSEQCNVPERDAAFVSQSVPGRVTVGQGFQAVVTMRNTGARAWSQDKYYRLGDNARLWGLARGFLAPSETVWPGYSKSFVLNLTAPSAPGAYDFQWQMVKDGMDAGWFGQPSAKMSIQVVPERDAAFVSQSVPTQVRPGQLFEALVTMRNTGGLTWTQADGYMLGTSSTTWKFQRAPLNLGESIPPGGTKTFNVELLAPTKVGYHSFQWRMLRNGGTWFGASTPELYVQVVASATSCTCKPGDACPSNCLAP
ncbi:S8A family peptidase [Cystobacter fuscus]|uniref:S8A family peptidase n=1 Tax=Cystobacter fuscus TaxID=43 RepID=A0A250J3R8_9BACT|nr:NBR1-Ig-like domain-containing protein [Cystobacter fuscus]ATB38148.1 S8A family peptidase [Cystobacter fuscus]